MEMQTRGNRQNYFALNDGYDSDAASEDCISSPLSPATQDLEEPGPSSLPDFLSQSAVSADVNSCVEILDDEILPSESASQPPVTAASSEIAHPAPQKSEWLWGYFQTREFPNEWIEKRNKKKRFIDREIRCTLINKDTGRQCNWSTTDSKRQTSTTNIRHHLKEKHGSLPPGVPEPVVANPKSTIVSLWGNKEKLTFQERLEKNLLRWVISSKQPFTVVESPAFRQIFKDIPGISLPFTSRQTLRQRLMEDFDFQRVKLKEELAATCKTIALSIDVWTSKNHLPILGIIGHWLTEEFEYREKVLEFKELLGPHSGENLAAAVESVLIELELEWKLLSITGDNASNNERMVLQLSQNLQKKCETDLLFLGLGNYVRCLAHIINLIVKDILCALKSGNTEEADAICNNLDEGEHQSLRALEPLARLRIIAVWIHRSPQRRQAWKENCKRMNLPDKFIEYDVETRWNSTFRMLSDALQARYQLEKFIHYETDFVPFSMRDWQRLSQIHSVLSKLNELTLFVSQKTPQISLSVPVYYELHDLRHDAAERKEDFADLDADIASAVKEGIKKYMKYYAFMDASDTYYTAMILDPRVKGELLRYELDDEDTSEKILQALRDNLHRNYPETTGPVNIAQPLAEQHSHKRQKLGTRMLQRLQPQDKPQLSDIDRYFNSAMVDVNDMEDPNWLCDWWRAHRKDYPRMAAVARDYLAIPASAVSVERLFNAGRDVLGVRRYSMKSETMRILMLLDDVYKQ